MNEIEVSVIIPVFNSERYIERCLDSIFNQTFRSFEIILIIDGSWDNSSFLCDCVLANNLDIPITIISQQNMGPSEARNHGIELASGKYFVCIDSDDVVEFNYLKELIKAKNDFSDCGHIWCGYHTYDGNKPATSVVYSENEEYSKLEREEVLALVSQSLVQSPCFHLYDTDFVHNAHLMMDKELSLGEDFVFNLRYLDTYGNHQIVMINKPLYRYIHENDQSLIMKYRTDLDCIYDKLREKFRYYLEKWDSDNNSWRTYWNWSFCAYQQVIQNYKIGYRLLDRIEKINSILRESEYQEALDKHTGYMNPHILIAHKSRNYLIVLFFEILAKFKNKMQSLFCKN